MAHSEAYELVTKELLKANDRLLRNLDAKIALMIANARYGVLRSTVMAQKYTVTQLERLRKEIFALDGINRSSSSPEPLRIPH